jgi:hypothetical protein
MIDVKELRIGNYVQPINDSGREAKIGTAFAINCNFVSVNGNNNPYDYHRIEPVLITEDILSKCNFVKREWGDTVVYYNPLMELDAYFRLNRVDYNIEVKYLHQLQNLFFDLTGRELEVKF